MYTQKSTKFYSGGAIVRRGDIILLGVRISDGRSGDNIGSTIG